MISERQPNRGQDTLPVVRIVLVDDHDVVREGLRKLLEGQPNWLICGEAANGREAVSICQKLKPDIVVLDISMPELNGLDASRQILKVSPTTEILIFTMHESDRLVRDILVAGARGYLLKSDPAHNVIDAVASLVIHRPYFNMRVSETILTGYLSAMAQDAPSTRKCASELLTGREREILQLLAEGRSNKEIARRLAIGVKTVETHRGAVMRKSGANSIVDLVRFAVRNHIVEF